MRSFAVVALATAASAAKLGYTIDLCPEPIGSSGVGESVYLPGNEELLALSNVWAKTGAAEEYEKIAYAKEMMKLGQLERLGMLQQLGNQMEYEIPTGYQFEGQQTGGFALGNIRERIGSALVDEESLLRQALAARA